MWLLLHLIYVVHIFTWPKCHSWTKATEQIRRQQYLSIALQFRIRLFVLIASPQQTHQNIRCICKWGLAMEWSSRWNVSTASRCNPVNHATAAISCWLTTITIVKKNVLLPVNKRFRTMLVRRIVRVLCSHIHTRRFHAQYSWITPKESQVCSFDPFKQLNRRVPFA